MDFTSKNVGTASATMKDENKDQATNASSKSLKTSFMYHYVQMSDPLNMVGSHHQDEQGNDDSTKCPPGTSEHVATIEEGGLEVPYKIIKYFCS